MKFGIFSISHSVFKGYRGNSLLDNKILTGAHLAHSHTMTPFDILKI